MIKTRNKTVLIDDDRASSLILKDLLIKTHSGLDVIKVFNDPLEALKEIKLLDPDILIVDIMMPGLSGLELVSMLEQEKVFDVVFVTSSLSYALEAFEHNVVDYMVKPIDRPKVERMIQKLSNHRDVQPKPSSSLLQDYQNQPDLPPPPKYYDEDVDLIIELPSRKGIKLISVLDILYLEAEGPYTNIQMNNGETIVVSKNIGLFEENLPMSLFYRIHRSITLNVTYVAELATNGSKYSVILDNEKHLPVSFRKIKSFKEFYIGFLKKQRRRL